ncbi:MAG: hypothetical protein LAT76_09035, partial [Schleiferiaceae bacterium]|nr:hypothetical protein [Schleiferiaceae bacterium]
EAAFRLDLPNGYIDGEQRKIPMYPAGAVTHKGFGLVAWKDTVFALPVQDNATALQVQIDNKTKSILGEELHSLANYAHDCNEQMSARLYGLVLLRDEGSRWNRLMNERKTNKLLKDLTSNQLENGTWTWWGKLGNPNLYMTQKIYENLLPLENENKRAQVLLEKGRQHFEDWFALAKTSHDTLNMLLLGARMGISQFNFEQHLQQIPDTNLTQQLTKGLIRSILGTAKPEATPLAFADTTSTGCYEWSTAQHSDHWRQTSTASLIGLEWLLNTGANDETLVKTLQGILAQRNGRAFYNTTHSAHFSRLLIQLEKQLRYTNEPPQIKFRDSVITTFPFEWRGLPTENDSLFITSNNQYVLVGGYQEFWERHPKKAHAGFTLSRQFLHNGKTSTTFNRSQQVVYDVQFSTTKTAEYLTLELPLPAGMTLEKEIYIKNASHVAYFRNRVVVYYERLPKGAYTLQLPLITRFSGVFQVNPARLGSMYWKHEENFTPLEVIGIE